PAGQARADAALSLGGRLHLWPAAWPGLCQRTGPGGIAAAFHPHDVAVLQCRRRDWAADVHRGSAGRDVADVEGTATAEAGGDTRPVADGPLRNWHCGKLLVVRA